MRQVDRLVHRLTAHARAERQQTASARCATCTPEQRLGLTFTPGDRVVDLVTGQKGVILAGTKETYLVPPADR